jgi:hypothetical protein
MSRWKRVASLIVVPVLLALFAPLPLGAADPIEAAGMGVGLTAGNAVVIPAKTVSVLWGLTSGALSFVLSGGNADLTAQIWRDVTEGPYMVTPDVARKAIGERPELNKQPGQETAPSYTPPAQ